ncbi:MAG: hypothetical protein D6781_08915 [Verrucomicrobia bacterium]|nr:MAG: hypothetical protein D6781_08915 [Verrucomicrobiota bacterium]
MKAFRFRLEPLITLRNWEEERARVAFGQAIEHERRIQARLQAVETDLEAGFRAWEQARIVREKNECWQHLEFLRAERANILGMLEEARREREEKARQLMDAHKRLQTLETLKNKRREAHLAEMRRREELELDDIVSARFQPDL